MRRKKVKPLLEGVEITAIAAEGKALARIQWNPGDDSKTVLFIPYGAAGDVADIQVERKKHSYAEGRIVRLVRESEARVQPLCSYFGVCGGCKWQHITYDEQLKWKRQQVVDCIDRIAKVKHPEIKLTLGSAEIWRYRNKMEYTFSDRKWRTREEIESGSEFTDRSDALGFHIPGAFDKVLHIDECHLQEEFGDEVRNFIYEESGRRGWDFYNIKGNKGLLRTLMLRTASTGQRMVCVTFGEDSDRIPEVMESISSRFPELTSLLYVINLKANDSIADQEIKVWAGREYIEEEMERLKFRVNAKSFYQTNSRQAYELYKVARRFAGLDPDSAKGGERPMVYDLYTGTGTIANFVARAARKVIGIEYVEAAVSDARVNSAANGVDNTEFYAGDMKDILTPDFIERHGHPDVMIIDPPRAGMHPDVVKTIIGAHPDTLVYVSCNPATQARDVAMLDPYYEITDIQPVDMFPHTHHVENVIRMVRRAIPTNRETEQPQG